MGSAATPSRPCLIENACDGAAQQISRFLRLRPIVSQDAVQ